MWYDVKITQLLVSKPTKALYNRDPWQLFIMF